MGFGLGENEYAQVDVSPPARTLLFPFLELVAITGLLWIAIGWIDNPASGWIDPIVRQTLVLAWIGLGVWRFGVPLLRRYRGRFMVTNRRILARPAQFRGRIDSIPLTDIRSVRRYKGGLSIEIYGFDRPLYFPSVPKTKKVEAILNQSLPRFHR